MKLNYDVPDPTLRKNTGNLRKRTTLHLEQWIDIFDAFFMSGQNIAKIEFENDDAYASFPSASSAALRTFGIWKRQFPYSASVRLISSRDALYLKKIKKKGLAQ